MKFPLLLVLAVALASAKHSNRKQEHSLKKSKGSYGNRIVGGAPVNIADYGWQVSLQTFGQLFCGGSIISANWILSAAHCFAGNLFPTFGLTVRAGSNLTNSGGSLSVFVDTVIVHPKYNATTFDNDASLVHVLFPLLLNDGTIRTANVVGEGVATAPGTLVTVTGWGATQQGGSVSSVLEGVTIPVIANSECEAVSPNPEVLTDTMICAGALQGGKDSCQGDSGGPLVDPNNVLVGIVSWGYGCAQPNSPGIYTNIASPSIRDFIRDRTGV